VILFFRLIITSVIGLFTSRYIIQSLGASDFGLYSVVGGIVVMMAFLNSVMTSTTYRYIAFEMGRENLSGVNSVFNISLMIHLLLAVLVLLLTETFGVYYVRNHLNIDQVKMPDAIFVLRFSSYATIFSIVSLPYQGLVTAQEKFSVRALIEIIRSLLGFFVALIIVYYLGNKLRLYALLLALVSVIPAAMFYVYCKVKYREIVKWNFQRSRAKYYEMIGFSGWIMIGAAASMGKTSGTALIINSFFGTLLNAAFGIANQVNGIVLSFSRNLSQAVIPQITKSFSGGNTIRTLHLASYMSKYTVFLMLIPALPILLETKFLLTLWLGELPPYTIVFVQLIIINAIIDGLGNGLPAVAQATGKIKYFQIILSTTSLMSLPIAYLLFKIGYPPSAIVLTYIFTALVNLVLWQIMLKKIINFDVAFFIKTTYLRVFYVILLLTPIFFLQFYLPYGLFRFIFISLISEIILLLIIYFAGLDRNESDFFKKLIKRYILKNYE
jgi:O-antigen/teichoic acid export membrane protein